MENTTARPVSPDVANPPLVSLIILTYERHAYLKEALTSAVNQTYPNLEIIVSDNCSPTNPASLVASFNDPRIRLRYNATNIGQTGNYLAAVKEARGKYVTFLHDDDLLTKDFVSILVARLEADEELVLAFSDLYLIDSQGVVDYEASEKATQTFIKDLKEGKHKPFHKEGLVDQSISGIQTVFRREAIDWTDIPASLPACCDLYLVYLFSMTGQAAYYESQRLAYYRFHRNQATANSSFPQGLIMCYERFLKDERLRSYWPEIEKKLAFAQANLGIILIKGKKTKEARPLLKLALRHKFGLRPLAALGLAYLPAPLVPPALTGLKRLRKIERAIVKSKEVKSFTAAKLLSKLRQSLAIKSLLK